MAVFKEGFDYPYQEGKLLLGYRHAADGLNYPVGVSTERHAITIGGARSGKGAGVILPNLKLWPESVLVIDPKGEAAAATAALRQDKGIRSYVVDPFQSPNVPADLRACFNPLGDLNPKSPTIKEEIEAITDGMVIRADPKSAHWDNGAASIISGLIAYVVMLAPPNERNLLTVRAILRNRNRFNDAMEAMQDMAGCGGLAESGASAAYSEESKYFVSNARLNTEWLDSEAMASALAASTFSLSDLKFSKASVYLVLPANRIAAHGRFLRLFVRCAIEAMAQPLPDGSLKGTRCLFLLDEFYTLGRIDEIAKAAGLMPGYGVHLWPFLQDLGQLQELYGREGAETFFGNADVHQFFGNMDGLTLEYVSRRLGNNTMDDMPLKQSNMPKFIEEMNELDGELIGYEAASLHRKHLVREYERADVDYETNVSRSLGKPRVPPEMVADLVRKDDTHPLAQTQIVFVSGMKALSLCLMPYWAMEKSESKIAWGKRYSPPTLLNEQQESPKAERSWSEQIKEAKKRKERGWMLWVFPVWFAGGALYFCGGLTVTITIAVIGYVFAHMLLSD